ncbi:ribokinase [Caproicibacter fermentans]|uniref:Ribokinase n=1 Tax=Caproicibacter fermentans TaxID=2576756 RepID=A0A7G8T7D1_9FIRM|nr:ribokinase [Caproicibacter fermentans]QNK39522.1 ribokinase [Caproicibacter fermentans]
MPKILNFGSLNIDNVFKVDHFVQPGETMAAESLELLPGGKGLNQSVALSRAGAEIYHAGKVGHDGRWLVDLLEKANVHTELIDQTGSMTGVAMIQVNSSGQNCIIIHHGANAEITNDYIDSVLSHFHKGDMLLLQNEINAISRIISKTFELGMQIAWNPSPLDRTVFDCPFEKITYFILNEIEGFDLTGEKEPDKIAAALLKRCPNAKVVLTLGKGGVWYQDRDRVCTHGIYKVPVVDTTGAGDTFTGFFLAKILENCPVEEALRIASVASSIEVSRKGASISIPTLEEVVNSDLKMQ